jgi:hypothetical protein
VDGQIENLVFWLLAGRTFDVCFPWSILMIRPFRSPVVAILSLAILLGASLAPASADDKPDRFKFDTVFKERMRQAIEAISRKSAEVRKFLGHAKE